MSTPDPKRQTGALNTLHQSLTADEWEKALDTAKERRTDGSFDQDRRDPEQTRHQAVRRCLLRVDRGDAAPGLYVVRSRDISDGGMRLVHGGRIEPETVCCVIIETEQGLSVAAGGVVAWCNPIEGTTPPAHELGINFYGRIDSSKFAPQAEDSEEVA